MIGELVIGGLGSIRGALLGAAFYVLVPELFRDMKDAPGLVFGISLMLVMVLLPRGLGGLRWQSRTRQVPNTATTAHTVHTAREATLAKESRP